MNTDRKSHRPLRSILLVRIQNGDDDALVALIEKYERLLKTIIHYEIRNVDAEEDIYQETVLFLDTFFVLMLS